MIELNSPASSANLGAGYDVFGLTLQEPRDKMVFRKSNQTRLRTKGKYSDKIPSDLDKNTAGVVAKELIKEVNSEVEVVIEKNIRPSSGLGSSAASSAGAAVGINQLYNLDLSKKELVKYAGIGEKAVGAPHLDNVAPLIYGGLCAINPETKEIQKLETPGFDLVLIEPGSSMDTSEARKIVPKEVYLEDVKKNIFYASSLITGAQRNDPVLFSEGLRDELVEPVRTEGDRFFSLAKEIALEHGAGGLTLSGSGPTLITTSSQPNELRNVLEEGLREEGFDPRVFVTGVSDGIEVISS